MLLRNTEWRQGNVLTQESFSALCSPTNSNTYAVIISHDCDLQNENEEIVEIIEGSVVPNADSNFTHARHIRRLQLRYQIRPQPEKIVIELTHVKRKCFPKNLFFEAAIAAPFQLDFEEKRVLKQWLSARYGRPAFPNEFETRLKKDKKLEKKLSRILSQVNSQLIGVFFDLGEERSIELPPEEPYFLRISIVYDSIQGPAARKAAEECATEISKLFCNIFGVQTSATEIVLDGCHAVADTHFSLADIRKVDQWRVEYISLRENPPGDFLSSGETPV